MIYPVILCGGSGTRLWPLSRKSYPKQFAQLNGDTSLFQQTLSRVNGDEFETEQDWSEVNIELCNFFSELFDIEIATNGHARLKKQYGIHFKGKSVRCIYAHFYSRIYFWDHHKCGSST